MAFFRTALVLGKGGSGTELGEMLLDCGGVAHVSYLDATSLDPGCIVNVGAIVDHDALLGNGVHAAPRATVKAGAAVKHGSKVESGQIVPSPWEHRAK